MTDDGRPLAALLLLRRRDEALAREALGDALRRLDARAAALALARTEVAAGVRREAQAREGIDALTRTGGVARSLAAAAARFDRLRAAVRAARDVASRAVADLASAEGTAQAARAAVDLAMAQRKVVEERLGAGVAAARRHAEARNEEEAAEAATARRPEPRGALTWRRA